MTRLILLLFIGSYPGFNRETLAASSVKVEAFCVGDSMSLPTWVQLMCIEWLKVARVCDTEFENAGTRASGQLSNQEVLHLK